MDDILRLIITSSATLIAAFAGSSGFWNYIQKKDKNKTADSMILLGLAHEAIINKCNAYIERGYIYEDEYKELNDYLYKPYKEKGGNGSAERAMQDVMRIEMRYR